MLPLGQIFLQKKEGSISVSAIAQIKKGIVVPIHHVIVEQTE